MIWQFSFRVIGSVKVKDYITSLRIVLRDKYLHLPCPACQCVCFVAILLQCWSPTVPPQWPISLLCLSLLNEIFALWGAGWRRGVRAITRLSSILPLALSLPQSSSFSLYCGIFCYFVCPFLLFRSLMSHATSSSVSSVRLQTPMLSVKLRRTAP